MFNDLFNWTRKERELHQGQNPKMIKKLDGDMYSSSQENDEAKKAKNSNSQLLEVKHCANDGMGDSQSKIHIS